MGAKVSGISQANANLRALVGDIQGKRVMRAIQSALLIGSAQALYTHLLTHQRLSTLNSGRLLLMVLE